MKQVHALFVLITLLLLSSSLGVTVAQTLSAPMDALSSSILGVGLYIYNPATQSIISPAQSGHGLTMVPWQYYDNSTMQWTVTLYGGATPSYYISAVSPQSAQCAAGTVAHWNANKKSAVSTLCTPSTSVYTNFVFVPTTTSNTYNINAVSNVLACVTIVNGVPTSPSTSCNPLGAYTQWQLVTISP